MAWLDTIYPTLSANSASPSMDTYAHSKFVHLLAAHYWRRKLGSNATVVAVSPGMVPATGLARHLDPVVREDHFKSISDKKDVPTGKSPSP